MATDKVFTLPRSKNLDGLTLPTNDYKIMFEKKIDDYKRLRADDTLITTYPRTGTTWLCQVVCLLLTDEDKYEEMKKVSYFEKVIYLEYNFLGTDRIEHLDAVPSPRAVKSHLPYRFIRRWIDEDNVKTIITTRNPKDTLVSLFHFYLAGFNYEFKGSWDDFFKHMQAGGVLYGDQYEWYKDWDDNRDKGRVMYIKYEDMKHDLLGQIKRIISFLDLKVSDKHVQQVIRDSNIKEMKPDFRDIPGFTPDSYVRTGQCGEWKKYFTVEQNEWFDRKYKKLYEGLSFDIHYE